jgi:MFS transporter, DHA3 family, tetracycline resistance protein
MNSRQAVVVALFVVDGLSGMSVIGFAVVGQFALALILFFLFTTARGPSLSLEQVWMNQHLDSSVRATLFSLHEQVNSIAQIVGGPLLGLLATQVNTRTALIVAGIILFPPLLLYARTLHSDKPLTDPIVSETSSVPPL